MCQEVMTHPGYTRGKSFLALKTKEENVFIGRYTSKKTKYNELVEKVFSILWEENKQEKRTIEQLIGRVATKCNVSIKIEEVMTPFSDPK